MEFYSEFSRELKIKSSKVDLIQRFYRGTRLIEKYITCYRTSKEITFLLILVGFIYTISLTPTSDVSFSDNEKWDSLISLERKSPLAP